VQVDRGRPTYLWWGSWPARAARAVGGRGPPGGAREDAGTVQADRARVGGPLPQVFWSREAARPLLDMAQALGTMGRLLKGLKPNLGPEPHPHATMALVP